MSARTFAEELRKWWSFDNGQQHTHSWHSREDFIQIKLPELLLAEGSPDEKVAATYLERRAKITKIVKKWGSFSHMQIHAGEMTAQEKRTVRAVVSAILREIENV